MSNQGVKGRHDQLFVASTHLCKFRSEVNSQMSLVSLTNATERDMTSPPPSCLNDSDSEILVGKSTPLLGNSINTDLRTQIGICIKTWCADEKGHVYSAIPSFIPQSVILGPMIDFSCIIYHYKTVPEPCRFPDV